MGTWKNLYLASLSCLAIAISVSFAYAAFSTMTTVNNINNQATTETLVKLPATDNFLGPPVLSTKINDVGNGDYNSAKTEVEKRGDYNKLSASQQFTYNLTSYIYFFGNSIPMILLIVTF